VIPLGPTLIGRSNSLIALEKFPVPCVGNLISNPLAQRGNLHSIRAAQASD